MNGQRYPRYAIQIAYAAAVLLLFTGALKLLALSRGSPLMAELFPLLPVRYRTVFLATGVFETSLAVALVFFPFHKGVITLATGFCAAVLTYRIGLWWLRPGKPCSCLGDLGEWSSVVAAHENLLGWLIALSLCGLVGICYVVAEREEIKPAVI
jgi:hypothetical protein